MSVEGFIYGFDLHDLQANTHRASRGRFVCLVVETGKMRWATDRVGQSTVIVADGKLILLGDTGTLILARLDSGGYRELGRTRVLGGIPCWTPPTLSRGRLYVRDQKRMACLHLGDPEHLRPDQRNVPATLPAPRWDLSKLVVVEPDYPNDLPTWDEFGLWFVSCSFVFGMAGFFAALAGLVSRASATVVFCAVALVAGAVGTTALGHLAGTFTLTWPAALFTALQITVSVVYWAENQPEQGNRIARRWSYLAGVAFLTLCLGYYELCKGVGLATGWTFLTGFLPLQRVFR